MQLTVQWGDLWAPVCLMVLSIILSLGTRGWRRNRRAAVMWRSRTHWEWLPFMFGSVAAIAELARLLDVPGPGIAIADVIARVLALTTVFMFFRTLFILFARGGRLLFRRRTADSSS
ncbi:hypothetical protein [Streptomyces sp. NPDC057301]|uniref:hypothetical protein n=1 Tax=Streptomyces sp. NPDC057301 TaxID=3346093 RepID=UPI003626D4D7